MSWHKATPDSERRIAIGLSHFLPYLAHGFRHRSSRGGLSEEPLRSGPVLSAPHIAAYSANKRAAIIDMDAEQATTLKWAARRNGKDQPAVLAGTSPASRRSSRRCEARGSGFDVHV